MHFRTPKAVKQIEQHANVTYYNKKRRYAICYVNEEELKAKMKDLKALKLVRKVEESLFDTEEYQINF